MIHIITFISNNKFLTGINNKGYRLSLKITWFQKVFEQILFEYSCKFENILHFFILHTCKTYIRELNTFILALTLVTAKKVSDK
jgi:hypothetical protein